MCRALVAAGLGQVLDIVPNHMAITGRENAWWWDVLENGPSSMYAAYFDVDWDPPEAKLRNTVLMPILGDHYGRVLEAGEIDVAREEGSFTVRYHEHAFPVAPRSLDTLLEEAARRELFEETGVANLALSQLQTFGRIGRDPRHRSITVAYFALTDMETHPLQAGTDARQARWFDLDDLSSISMAFDHAEIIAVGVAHLQKLASKTK